MGPNKLSQSLEIVKKHPNFINLMEGSFHKAGLIYPKDFLLSPVSNYFQNRNYFPDSLGYLPARQAIVDFYRERGLETKTSQIVLTGSTSEAYRFLFSMVSPQKSLLLPRPGYPLFEQIAALCQRRVEYYDLTGPYWQPDVKGIKKLEKEAGLLVLISPNNPTGSLISRAVLESLGDALSKGKLPVLSDEVFDLYVQGEELQRYGQLHPQLPWIQLNGISKRFASPDLKLGWMALGGPDHFVRSWMERLELVNDTFLSANALTQSLLPYLFEKSSPHQKQWKKLIEQNRALLGKMEMPRTIKSVFTQAGVHFVLELDPKLDDEELALELLNGTKVLLHPGYLYDFPEDNYLVGSLLQNNEAFSTGLKRVFGFLEVMS